MGAQPLRSIGYDPIVDVAGKNILLVDAFVRAGITLDHLVQQSLLRTKSVRTAALIDRKTIGGSPSAVVIMRAFLGTGPPGWLRIGKRTGYIALVVSRGGNHTR